MDPYEIGWYLESADENVYGPASRATLQQFLKDGTITPNTLVRHCTEAESRPVADRPEFLQDLELAHAGIAIGDRLEEVWPRKRKERQALALGSTPCAWHKYGAEYVCARCHAPYCSKCRNKSSNKKQFFFCRRCQSSVYNRRFLAYFVDIFGLVYLPFGLFLGLNAVLRMGETGSFIAVGLLFLGFFVLAFRDAVFRGQGPGKRLFGLRVVKSSDGATPLSYGQSIIRWSSLMIPYFNLIDMLVPYWDPRIRRFGDRWAGTRVIDTERALAKARSKIERRLLKKGIQIPADFGMSMAEFARIE